LAGGAGEIAVGCGEEARREKREEGRRGSERIVRRGDRVGTVDEVVARECE
jgi:hypothetical protein